MIDVAADFSAYPSGRFSTDGQFNGELFRSEHLEPALRGVVAAGQGGKVIVDIDGVRTFGSSFLEEAFAGLIRLRLFDKRTVQKHLVIKCSKEHLSFFKDAINTLVEAATPAQS